MAMHAGLNKTFMRRWLDHLRDPRNIALYIFCAVVLAIAWSGVRTMQSNYSLQKKIAALKQQDAVLRLQNENAALQNDFYQTDEYLDLAARQDLGLAAPGEKVELIPKAVALKYVDQSLAPSGGGLKSADTRSKIMKNIEAWRDFLLGRKVTSD
ncbi:MAG TPA: septum formation initiator family protein [Candidatus Saccharimonadales bacterium]|nr:septum formation initiator family protein [Candidatus Saccharimonadales bacterium]